MTQLQNVCVVLEHVQCEVCTFVLEYSSIDVSYHATIQIHTNTNHTICASHPVFTVCNVIHLIIWILSSHEKIIFHTWFILQLICITSSLICMREMVLNLP